MGEWFILCPLNGLIVGSRIFYHNWANVLNLNWPSGDKHSLKVLKVTQIQLWRQAGAHIKSEKTQILLLLQVSTYQEVLQ